MAAIPISSTHVFSSILHLAESHSVLSSSKGSTSGAFLFFLKNADVISNPHVLTVCIEGNHNIEMTMGLRFNLKSTSLSALLALAVFTGCGVSDSEEDLAKLVAKIDESAVTFVTDLKAIDGRRIKAGQSISLRDVSLGEPDTREWTFSDNSPAQTGQTITKSWTEAAGQVKIILKVTRTADNATPTDTLELQVGPVEMLNRAVFGFEDVGSPFTSVSKWYFWTPNNGTVTASLETASGANGTGRSLKLNALSNFGEFQLRPHENGKEFLVSLSSNTTYVFSFYVKASQAFTLSEATLLNVKNDEPKEGWYTPFWSGDASKGYAPINVTTSWTRYSYEFTTANVATFEDSGYADGKADNAGPFFKHFASISSPSLDVWFDEISLKPKETN